MTNSLIPSPLNTVPNPNPNSPTEITTVLSPHQHLTLHLKQLRLTHMLSHWESIEHQAMQEKWSYARFLLALCEQETIRRNALRLQRGLSEAQLPSAKSFSNFDFSHCPDFNPAPLMQLAETSVLFELIAHRYERKSLLITANQPFSQWDSIFTDSMMTVAAVDRLVHHATIFDIKTDSYRRQAASHRTNNSAAT